MDKYHQTNPPTELKSDVLGRESSKKKAAESDGQSRLVEDLFRLERLVELQGWHHRILDIIRMMSLDDATEDIREALKPAIDLCRSKVSEYEIEMPAVGRMVFYQYQIWIVGAHDPEHKMFEVIRRADGKITRTHLHMEEIYIDWEPFAIESKPSFRDR